jgi:type I restriction enzyme M protein
VAIVYEGFERILTVDEIEIARVTQPENEYGLTPHLLLYLLAHPQVRAQYEHKTFYETIIWNIAHRWRQVLLPIPRDHAVREEIDERVRSIVDKRRAGLLEMRELWDQPILPYAEDRDIAPVLEE